MTAADLKSFALLAEFNEEDREALFELLEPKTLGKGRSIFREGTEADGLVFLVSGRLVLCSKRWPEDAIAGEGTVLGGLSLFAVGPREVTAKAEVPCDILQLPRTSFRRLVEDAPRAACRLAEALAKELADDAREALDAMVIGVVKTA